MLKLTTSIRAAQKSLKDMDKILRAATAQTLIDTAKNARTVTARQFRDTGYSRMNVGQVQALVRRRYHVGAGKPADEQWASMRVGGSDIPAHHMRVKIKRARTAYGLRDAVSMSQPGAKGFPKANSVFPLRSMGRGGSKNLTKPDSRTVDRTTRLFIRKADGGLEQWRFRSVSEVLVKSGRVDNIVDKASAFMAKRLIRNYMRFAHGKLDADKYSSK